jgi:short subunit dehydrogenase-like uncharacterized protein
MTSPASWMIYGAAGHTGGLLAQHARDRGHQPLLAGRQARAIAAVAERLDVPYRTMTLDDPLALQRALADVELVLNAAGPFVDTARPLTEACLVAGTHYLDISNELQVFRSLYEFHERAERANVTIIPGVGFGVVATNCLARYVSDALEGTEHVEVAALAAIAHAGRGAEATRQANLPYGGWIRRAGQLRPQPLGEGTTTITFPTGPYVAMPVPTGDLEAAFRATGAPNVTAYLAVPDGAATLSEASDEEGSPSSTQWSYAWARATRADDVHEAWLRTGESYEFTADAAISSVEHTLAESPPGAWSPADAFGAEFPLSLQDTLRIDAIVPAEQPTIS